MVGTWFSQVRNGLDIYHDIEENAKKKNFLKKPELALKKKECIEYLIFERYKRKVCGSSEGVEGMLESCKILSLTE